MRAPAAARRLAGAIHILQLIIDRIPTSAAGAPRAAAAVASTTSMARTSCCPAPGRRHPHPAADHRPDPHQRRRRGGQHQVDLLHQLLHGAWPAPPCSPSGSPAGTTPPPAPPARRARAPRWPAPRQRRAPAAARRLAGAITFPLLIIGRDYTQVSGSAT
ncbi:hypothetical protein ACWYXJ_28950 [Janthinobacterium lividum]